MPMLEDEVTTDQMDLAYLYQRRTAVFFSKKERAGKVYAAETALAESEFQAAVVTATTPNEASAAVARRRQIVNAAFLTLAKARAEARQVYNTWNC